MPDALCSSTASPTRHAPSSLRPPLAGRHLCLCSALLLVGCASEQGAKGPAGTSTNCPEPTAQTVAHSSDGAQPGGPLATYESQGLVTCFPANTMRNDKPDQPATCEVSAVTVVGDAVLLASDKAFPGAGRSSIFQVPLQRSALGSGAAPLAVDPTGFLTAPPIVGASKFEDFTQTPSGDRVFVTTGFDRVKDDGSWDGYNTLLTWKTDAPGEVAVVTTPDAIGGSSSVSLRAALSLALATEEAPEGQPYFKVEGLAATDDGRLLLGIREQGASYKEFEYAIDVLEARYSINEVGAVTIDPASVRRLWRGPPALVLGHRVALSSLALDAAHQRLMMLTSFEHEETDSHVGGFLFVMPLAAIERGDTAPFAEGIVRAADGFPFIFGHKPEGITSLGDGRWLVVHDDDRVTTQRDIGLSVLTFDRGLHEAAYTVIKLR